MNVDIGKCILDLWRKNTSQFVYDLMFLLSDPSSLGDRGS